VTVTNRHQVKGLEFDAVIVVNPDEASYPATDAGRRLLYTVLSRARERLWLVAVDEPTTLLGPAITGGLLEVDALDEVPEVRLDEPADEPF
jgi:superfamily I DNA/RNA helicase